VSGTNCTAVPPAVWNFNPARLRPWKERAIYSGFTHIAMFADLVHVSLRGRVGGKRGGRVEKVCTYHRPHTVYHPLHATALHRRVFPGPVRPVQEPARASTDPRPVCVCVCVCVCSSPTCRVCPTRRTRTTLSPPTRTVATTPSVSLRLRRAAIVPQPLVVHKPC